VAYDLKAGYKTFAVAVIGASTKASVTLQGSVDGNTWFAIKSAVKGLAAAAPTPTTNAFPVQFLRGISVSTSTAAFNAHVTVT
jgi:hypothetical protein